MPISNPIRSGGVASGIDTESIVQKLVSVQSIGLRRLQIQKVRTEGIQSAYTSLSEKLTTLKSKVSALNLTSTLDARTASISDATVLTATAAAGTSLGTYSVSILQASTATKLNGGTNISNGTLNVTATLNSSGLSTTVSPSTGNFSINGTAISYDTSVDSVNSIISQINSSAAGVLASYDSVNDRMILTNKNNGPTAISVSDNSGNLGFALGLTSGTSTTLGQSAQIQINGGATLSSNDDIFTDAETGITGLTLTLKKGSGTAQVTVASDTASIRTAFDSFVTAYNDVVDFTTKQSAISGPETAKVTGPFSGDQSVQFFQRSLRETVGARFNGQPEGYESLISIGVGTTGRSPDISVFDGDKLSKAFTDNPSSAKTLLTDSTNGIMAKLNTFLNSQSTGANGLIKTKESRYNDQITRLKTSIDRETRNLKQYEERTRASFEAMERAVSSFQGGLSQILSNLNPTSSN